MRKLAALLAVLLLAAACGSTTHKKETASNGKTIDGSSSGSTSSAAPGTSASPGATDGGTTSTGTIGGGGGAGVTPPKPVAGGGPVILGQGVTPTTIKIGFNHSAPLGPAFKAVGFAGDPKATDERRILSILIQYYNKHGGLGGRKIEPVWNQYDAVGGGTWDSLAASACQKFVADEKVFAVVSGHVGQTDSLTACLAKGHVPIVQQNQWPYDGVEYKNFSPYLYQPSRMRPERWAPAFFAGLKAGGYFNSGYKLGVLKYEGPVFDRIYKMYEAAAKANGIVITDVESVNTPQSVSDFGQLASEMQTAFVKMQSKGVNHVIFDEYAGEAPFFGLTVAENQGFRPRWGFSSVNLPNTQQAQAKDNQLKDSMIVSWLPGQDVADAPYGEIRSGGALKRCLDIIKAGGMTPSRLYDGVFCDSMFFLEKIFSVTNNITPQGMYDALPKLGDSYDSPYTWKTHFSAGRPDGASAVMIGKYQLGCHHNPEHGCYKYTGSLRNAP